MTHLKSEPMVKDYQVHTTEDYFMFKPIDGNRNKNLLHINRLKKSMAENYLFTIIIVNEKYEIIDGQHRFHVIEELKLPLHYIVCKGYGLEEVHIFNATTKTWNADDYLEGYCKLGYKQYLKYKEFKETYNIGHNECMALLSGGLHHANMTKIFYSGLFTIQSYDDACKTIEKIFLVEPYYDGFKRRSFINTMIALFKKPEFEFTEFLQKLKCQPTALVNCNDITQYISLIEEIYNYRRREKVNLRY